MPAASARLSARCALLFAAALAATPFAALAAKADAEPPPFIHRIQPVNFARAQQLFLADLTRDHSIVILQINSGRPVSALALGRAPEGDFTVTLRVPPATPGGDWLTADTTLAESVGRQVERAVALTLNRHVLVAPTPRPTDDDEIAVWLYQRLPDSPTAAAVIEWTSLREVPAAARFLDELVGRLQRLGAADGPARETLQIEIDQIATQIAIDSAGP